ncbi:ABC transporter permease [Acidobacteriota bacterium]
MRHSKVVPFKIIEKIITHSASTRYNEMIIGDFVEIYREVAQSKGEIRARAWLAVLLLTSLPHFLKESLFWSLEMIKNYLKITMRNMRRNKGSFLINTVGLAIGIACSLFIFLWVQDELSYDRFHEYSGRIHRVAVSGLINGTELGYTLTPLILGETLALDFPEVEQSLRIYRPRSIMTVKYGNQAFTESRILFVEKNFFDVFTFPMREGDPERALDSPTGMVMTQSTASKYFGSEDPIGKEISFLGEASEVTGVVDDVPHSSHFQFDILVPLHSSDLNRPVQWMNNFVITYILLKEGQSPQSVEDKFPELIKTKIGDLGEGNRWAYYLQPLNAIHLESHIDYELGENGNITYVRVFSLIGIFIIFIACINFINLTTAKASRRAKEVGIRKVSGSHRSQLIRQFLSESIFQSLIALILAIMILFILMPAYRNLVDKPIEIIQIFQPFSLLIIIGMTLLVGVFSGSYPAFLLSSFNPSTVLKGKLLKSRKKVSFRNILVILQFSLSLFLIVGTLVVYRQLEFMKDKNLGFSREQVLVIKNPKVLGDQMDTFKQDLLNEPQISSAAVTSHLPGYEKNFVGMGFSPEGLPWISLETWIGDEDTLETLKMEMKEGRFFSSDFPSDNRAIILNETAVKDFGWKDPLGMKLKSLGEDWTVIGVIKDMHYQSLQKQIRPMGLLHMDSGYNGFPPKYMSIRLKTEDVTHSISSIARSWENHSPGFPIEYSFLDDAYNNLYINEQKTSVLSVIFSLLAILIAALGLFGLASFMAVQRTKEIGIRKVLGATASGITSFLVKGFLFPVAAANIIAIPLVVYVMNGWLRDFAYHTDIHWWMFVLSAAFSIGVALITVSYQTLKAAMKNPVDSLRYE